MDDHTNALILCAECGEPFERTRHRHKFCCRECSYKHKGRSRVAELEEVAALRRRCGLKAPKAGEVICLNCERTFHSPDVINGRLCGRCHAVSSNYAEEPYRRIGLGGVS